MTRVVNWRGARAVAPGFDGVVIEQLDESGLVLAVNGESEGRWLDLSAVDLEFGFLPKGMTPTSMQRAVRKFKEAA